MTVSLEAMGEYLLEYAPTPYLVIPMPCTPKLLRVSFYGNVMLQKAMRVLQLPQRGACCYQQGVYYSY